MDGAAWGHAQGLLSTVDDSAVFAGTPSDAPPTSIAGAEAEAALSRGRVLDAGSTSLISQSAFCPPGPLSSSALSTGAGVESAANCSCNPHSALSSSVSFWPFAAALCFARCKSPAFRTILALIEFGSMAFLRFRRFAGMAVGCCGCCCCSIVPFVEEEEEDEEEEEEDSLFVAL